MIRSHLAPQLTPDRHWKARRAPLVAAEMLGAEYGIGAYILEAGSLYDLERLFAGVVILSVLGILISTLIGWIETRLLRWRG